MKDNCFRHPKVKATHFLAAGNQGYYPEARLMCADCAEVINRRWKTSLPEYTPEMRKAYELMQGEQEIAFIDDLLKERESLVKKKIEIEKEML